MGPGPLPRRGDLGDVQYIVQEVISLHLVSPPPARQLGPSLAQISAACSAFYGHRKTGLLDLWHMAGGHIGPASHLHCQSTLYGVRAPVLALQVDAGRIEAICKAKVRLNPDTVLDPEAPQGLHAAVRQLQRLQVPDLAYAFACNSHRAMPARVTLVLACNM